MSVYFFGPFIDWIIYFSGITLHELLIYFGDWFFVSCFICYYFLPFLRLPFHLAYSFLHYEKAYEKLIKIICLQGHTNKNINKYLIKITNTKICKYQQLVSICSTWNLPEASNLCPSIGRQSLVHCTTREAIGHCK